MEINKNLRKKAKNESQKNFFKLINNGILKKTMRNVRKYLLAIEMRKTDTYEQTNVIKFINIRIN